MIIIEANKIPIEVFEWYANNIKGIISQSIKQLGITKKYQTMLKKIYCLSEVNHSLSDASKVNNELFCKPLTYLMNLLNQF